MKKAEMAPKRRKLKAKKEMVVQQQDVNPPRVELEEPKEGEKKEMMMAAP